jgi:hypothetical protein
MRRKVLGCLALNTIIKKQPFQKYLGWGMASSSLKELPPI